MTSTRHSDWPRQDEFRIPELDKQSSKADKNLIGTQWFASRHIHRIGYMFMNHQEVALKEDELIMNEVKTALQWYKEVLDERNRDRIATDILQRMKDRGFPLPTYQARGQVAFEKRKDAGEDALWRSMWFCLASSQFPYQNPFLIEITGTQRFMTGRYYPASGGSYQDYEGGWDSDYEPGGLNPGYHQTLYVATSHYKTYSGKWEPDSTCLIHPNDLLSEELAAEVAHSNSWNGW
jgi:hypothetical protein